MAYIYTTIKID